MTDVYAIKPGDIVERIKNGGAHPRWHAGYRFTVAYIVGNDMGQCAVDGEGYDHNVSSLKLVQAAKPAEPVTGTADPAAVQPGKALKIEYADGTTAYALISHVVPPAKPERAPSTLHGRNRPEPQGVIPLDIVYDPNGNRYAHVNAVKSGVIHADDLREAAHYFNQVAEWLEWSNDQTHDKRVEQEMKRAEHKAPADKQPTGVWQLPHTFERMHSYPLVCVKCGCGKTHPVHDIDTPVTIHARHRFIADPQRSPLMCMCGYSKNHSIHIPSNET